MKQQKKRRRGRALLKLFAVVLIIGIVAAGFVAGTNLHVRLTTREKIFGIEDAEHLKADCILILGCGLRRDGYPSQMLRDRLDVGIEAYNMGISDRILMSGDHGSPDYDEVNAMKDYAIARGVPSEAIFMDHAGFSTYESMVRAREIFGCNSVVIVTQNYHLYRSIYNAEAMGMEAYGIHSNLRSYARQKWFSLREAAARTKDFFFCILKPEPTYLGEAIPIFGNGDVTNDR